MAASTHLRTPSSPNVFGVPTAGTYLSTIPYHGIRVVPWAHPCRGPTATYRPTTAQRHLCEDHASGGLHAVVPGAGAPRGCACARAAGATGHWVHTPQGCLLLGKALQANRVPSEGAGGLDGGGGTVIVHSFPWPDNASILASLLLPPPPPLARRHAEKQ